MGQWVQFVATNDCGGLVNYVTYAALVGTRDPVFVEPVLGGGYRFGRRLASRLPIVAVLGVLTRHARMVGRVSGNGAECGDVQLALCWPYSASTNSPRTLPWSMQPPSSVA